MSKKIGSLFFEINAETKKLKDDLTSAKSAVGELGKGANNLVKDFAGIDIATIGASAALAFFVKQMGDAERAAVESARADAKLEAVLKSTGGAAGMTSDQLNELADNISRTTGLDDELVKSSEAVLLTFTQIGSQVFPETIKAAADMSAVFGQDLQSSITQVGKAMNDFSGYTALKRVGVSFTEEQIKQINNFKETNDLVGYQNLILEELGREYGGAAKAINDAGDGSENLNVSIGNLQEEIGRGLVPQQRYWNKLLAETADKLTDLTSVNNDYTDELNELGIVRVRGAIYMKDGIRIGKEEVDSMLARAQEARDMADAYGDAAESVKTLSDTEVDLKQKFDLVASYISGDVTETYTKFNEKNQELWQKSDNLVKKIGELEGKSWLTEAQKEELATLKNELGENKKAIEANEVAYKRETNEFILSTTLKYMSLDGLSQKDLEVYTAMAENMGLLDKPTKDLIDGIGDIATQIDTSKTSVDEFAAALSGIPDKNVNVNVKYNYTGAGQFAGQWDNSIPEGHANGANFTVPPGYGGDSYGMRVQSGEKVKVTQAGVPDDTARMLRALPAQIGRAVRDGVVQGLAQ
jgi:hypothetical protein